MALNMQGLQLSDLLPAAIGIALSPLPIVAVILMLFSSRAKANGVSFVAGWSAGLLVVGGAILLLGGSSAGTSSEPSQTSLIIQLLLGLLLLAAALKQWRGFRAPSDEPATPAWMRTIDDFSAGKAFLVAALLSGVNPKNLALNAAGVLVIAEAGRSSTQEWITLVVFVVLSSLTVALPVLYYFVGGEKAKVRLDSMKIWLIANNGAVMAVLFLIFGVKLVAAGAQGLIAL
jgi:hypothetical protein